MKKVLWFVFLILSFVCGLIVVNSHKQYTVKVGPHQTYRWISGSGSTIVGNDETHINLISMSGNFTIYDENGAAVVSGVSPELKPGETAPIFVADIQLESDKQYILGNNSVDVYTTNISEVHFDAFRSEFFFIVFFSGFALLISFLIVTQ